MSTHKRVVTASASEASSHPQTRPHLRHQATHKPGGDSLCIRAVKLNGLALAGRAVVSPHRRSANRSATAPPLHLPDSQGGYCWSRTAGRPATQPRPASVCPSGEDPSGPAGPTHRLHRGSPHAATSAAALTESTTRPATSPPPSAHWPARVGGGAGRASNQSYPRSVSYSAFE